MKKLLLLSALAVSAMSVNAEGFGDYYKLLYEGQELTNDQEIVVKNAEYDAEWQEYSYECVIQIVNMKDEAGKMFGGMYFTGTPTYDEVIEGMMQDPWTWGMPQICGEQCFGMTKDYVGEGSYDILPSSAGLEQTWQIHIQSIATDDKISKYDLFFAACDENGERIEDADISLRLVFGDDGSGVESISVADEAPVFYDLQGRMVANPEKGIYIVKRGAKVAKELVR